MSTETSAPGNLATSFEVRDFVGAAVIVGVLAAGTTFVLRHFVYEPQEERAAFIEISRSSDAGDELRSDRREGTGPNREQGRALREAREAIAQAKAALNRAAR
jgi:hypothetical protein